MGDLRLKIFDIERFALHDGPGIRTTVFLKGCPLRCPWCANPESWDLAPSLLQFQEKCAACGICASLCHQKAIVISEGEAHINRKACTLCGTCAEACPGGALALSGREMTAKAAAEHALRDRAYYESSRGGVTLSGGEPLFQWEGALELLNHLKNQGIHTALETTGNVPWALFQKSAELVDLYLFDIKHASAEKLHSVTGGDFDLILKNLSFLAENCPERVVLRVPVIPGFNFSREEMRGIFDIAARLGIRRAELLPYHTLGSGKFRQLGLEYAYKDRGGMLDKQALAPLVQLGTEMGLDVKSV